MDIRNMARKQDKPYQLFQRGRIWHVYYSFKIGNKRVQFRESTGTHDERKAKQIAQKRYAELIYNNQLAPNGKKEITTSAAFAMFWEDVGQYHRNATDTFNKLNYLTRFFDEKKLFSSLNADDLTDFINRKKKDRVENSTINRYLSTISAIILNIQRRKTYNIPDLNPREFMFHEKAKNIVYLDNREVAQKIINLAANHLKPIIETAIITGLRRSNLLNLKWDNIDFGKKTICVLVKDKNTDGGRPHECYITPHLEKVLREIPKISEYVFNYKNKKISDIKRSWHSIFYEFRRCTKKEITSKDVYEKRGKQYYKRFLRDERLPYINFHALRHTFGTWLYNETGDIQLTQEAIGHKDIKTTKIYAHTRNVRKINAIEKTFNNIFNESD